MVFNVVLFVLHFTSVFGHLPLCEFFILDSVLPEVPGTPQKHKVDISLKVSIPLKPCSLDTNSALDTYNRSNMTFLSLFIDCYGLQVNILPISGKFKSIIKTFDLNLMRCNTTYANITNLAEGRIILLAILSCNITLTGSSQELDVCYGVDKVLQLYFDNFFDENLWRILKSCQKILKNVHTLSIKRIAFNDVNDVYKFRRLQSVYLSDVSLDYFPPIPISAVELEHGLVYPNLNIYSAPFTRTISNFNIVARVVDYSYNNITSLPSHITYKYIPLHYLLLRHNKIRTLPIRLLLTIRHLIKFDVSFNFIEAIPEGLFAHQRLLQIVDFQSNRISSVPNKLFLGLVYLNTVNFANNRIATIDPGLFHLSSTIPNTISNINFADNMLQHIPKDFVSVCKKVAKVDFRNNSLTDVPSEILTLSDLQMADFSFNPINGSAIAKLAFSSLDLIRPMHDLYPVLDFSNSQVSMLPDGKNVSDFEISGYQRFFSSYKVLFNNNPINCSCSMRTFVIDLLSVIRFARPSNDANNVIVLENNFFESWKCYSPPEYKGFEVIKLPSSEFYCRAKVTSCPIQCECFEYENGRLLVDCSRANLTDIPEEIQVPNVTDFRIHTSSLEEINSAVQEVNKTSIHLILAHAQLSDFTKRHYLKYVTKVDVGFNRLTNIKKGVLEAFKDRENFSLDISNNQISVLPKEIMSLHFSELKLGNNPYICDCTTLWMKYWIRDRRVPITDWNDITCLDIHKRGHRIVSVSDDNFVCASKFNTLKKVVLPAVCVGIGALCTMICLILVYSYKQELKVLLFIYFGIHPFDKEEGKHSVNEYLDVFIVHPKSRTKWILDNLVQYLERNRLSVITSSRNSILGYTYNDNIKRMIEITKRVIICIETSDDFQTDWFCTSWTLSKNKIKSAKTNYVVLFHHGKCRLQIRDNELKRYVRRGRLIKSSESIPFQRMLYFMPVPGKTKHHLVRAPERPTANPLCETKIKWSVFISYDTDDLRYVRYQLVPLLEQSGLILHIPDRDFDAGVPNEENFVKAVDGSKYTLFIVTKEGFSDEWRQFVFNIAREKSVAENSNRLIAVLKGPLDVDQLPEDLMMYVKTYTCCSTDDSLFEHCLIDTLTGGNYRTLLPGNRN